MAKKHWIYLKRGLSENPKHRASMGECIWLYMHIIDRADWETGIAYDWKDAEEANDMGMSVDTLRRQRQKLVDNGYIKCELKQHSQNIYIYEWKNPRDYGSDTKNPRIQGSHQSIPSEIQGLNQVLTRVVTRVLIRFPYRLPPLHLIQYHYQYHHQQLEKFFHYLKTTSDHSRGYWQIRSEMPLTNTPNSGSRMPSRKRLRTTQGIGHTLTGYSATGRQMAGRMTNPSMG